jgi:hypothetical protein
MRSAGISVTGPIGIDPTPELVRVESVAVIPYAQFVSAAKVAEDVLSRMHHSATDRTTYADVC